MTEEKEYKHYNSGHVWGRVAAAEEKAAEVTGTPYLAITLECPNEMFGNIKTYGRLWGRKKVERFMAYHKDHPGMAYHFQGFFSQYEKDNQPLWNYTFFQWTPFTSSEFRVAFILVGEIVRTVKTDADGIIFLYLEREGTGDREPVKEDFQIFTLNAQEVDGLEPGMIIKAKGVLRYKEAEDFFGDTPEGKVRPYIMELKTLGATGKEPF
jgi:hypothetical protein